MSSTIDTKPYRSDVFAQESGLFESINGLNVQNTVTDMMVAISDNSSTVSSQDENDLKVQERILSHLVEPQKPFQGLVSSQGSSSRHVHQEPQVKQTNYLLDSLNCAFELEDYQSGLQSQTRIEIRTSESFNFKKSSRKEVTGKLDFDSMQEEYLSRSETLAKYNPNVLKSFRGASSLETIDPLAIMTARQNAIDKRRRGEMAKKAIKVIQIVFEGMARNRLLGDFTTLHRLTLLCRRLYRTLDHNKVLFFLSEDQRLRLYV